MEHTPKKRWWGVALLCSAALAVGAGAGAQGQEAPAQPDPAAESCGTSTTEAPGGLWSGGRTHNHAV
jgi:hypothetical protein